MKLENQVVSLDLAKRLKELGVPQDSIFKWILPGSHNPPLVKYKYDSDYYTLSEADAFTVAELGEMLPRNVQGEPLQICRSFSDGWFVGYGNHMDLNGWHVESADTEVDARAKMLIYLLENKLIPV